MSHIVAFSQYPQYSCTTTGTLVDRLLRGKYGQGRLGGLFYNFYEEEGERKKLKRKKILDKGGRDVRGNNCFVEFYS